MREVVEGEVYRKGGVVAKGVLIMLFPDNAALS